MFWPFNSSNNNPSTLDAAGNLVEKTGEALDSLFTSDEERAAAEVVKSKIKQMPQAWAHQLNLINAQSRSWFDSGWRPALGWVGAIGLAVYFIPQYVMATILWVRHCLISNELVAYPITSDGLFELVGILFGPALLRSQEKKNGTARQGITVSEDRLNNIEKAVDGQGKKIDRLVEGFAALTSQNERISSLADRQDKTDDRLHALEEFRAQQQARREIWQMVFTRYAPTSLTIGAVLFAAIKLYVLN